MILHARKARQDRAAGAEDSALRLIAMEGISSIGDDFDMGRTNDLTRAHYAELLFILDQQEEARALFEELLANGYPTPAESDEDRAAFAELCASLGMGTDSTN